MTGVICDTKSNENEAPIYQKVVGQTLAALQSMTSATKDDTNRDEDGALGNGGESTRTPEKL